MKLIVQLTAAGSAYSVQVLVALQTAALHCFARRNSLWATAATHGVGEGVWRNHVCGWVASRYGEVGRRKTTTKAIHARHANWAEASTAVRRAAAVIRTSPVIVLTVPTTPHDPWLVQACAIPTSNAIAAPGATCTDDSGHASWSESARKSPWISEVGHILQAKPPGGTALAMTSCKREMSVAVGVGAGWGDA